LEAITRKVQRRAVQEWKRVLVDNYLRVVRLEQGIVRAEIVGIVEGVRKTGATHLLDPQAQTQALTALGQGSLDLPGRTFSQLNRHWRLLLFELSGRN